MNAAGGMATDFRRIAVIGTGAWGSALAGTAHRAGREVVLIAQNAALAAAVDAARESPELPGVPIDTAIAVSGDMARAAEADAVLMVVPAQAVRDASRNLVGVLRPGTPVICCAKGIERGSHKFMSDILAEILPEAAAAVLSGPSFAIDVAHGLPTAVTLAAADEGLATGLARALGSPAFRPYHSTDIRGVEIGGAAKNVLAIATGIVAGRGLGASAAAALITRAFAELFRFGEAFGARPQTLTGLSGLGDLVLTCSSPQSRNFSLGLALGRGEADALKGGKLAEGAFTADALVEMASARGIDMPIAQAVAAILAGRLTIDAAIEALTTRPLKAE